MANQAAVIFDLDGTLADTLADLAAAANHVLAAFNKPPLATRDYRDLVGRGVDRLLARAMGLAADTPVPQARQQFMAYYTAHLCDHSRLYPGIAPLLEALTARRTPLGILSNKPDSATQTLVRELLGQWRFGSVRGHSEAMPPKPDPAAALAVAQTLDCPPAKCVYLGDSDVDMHTARAAGMHAIGAAWGFRSKAELTRAGAQQIIEQPAQLLPIVDATADAPAQA